MTQNINKEPIQAWITAFAGVMINLCLGILYAWSIWKKALVDVDRAGELMDGVNTGWIYLNNAQAATPFTVCVIFFMLCMIPGGKIQDQLGPKLGATFGGLFLALGCIIAGLTKSYTGLIIGFGVFGGIGMGIGYAAPTPAALKWFGAHKRGLIAGLVVGGYGGAAIYISPLAQYIINKFGITSSFIYLGLFFAFVVIVAGQLLKTPDANYVPPTPKKSAQKDFSKKPPITTSVNKYNWRPSEVLKTWQYYVLVIMFILCTQSGLLIIANAAGILQQAASVIPFLVANAWLLASYGGIVNATGRVGTGIYSDKLGRAKSYALNCGISALCMFLLPYVVSSKNIVLLFIVVGIGYWQYGGGLSLMPSFCADFYGSKNLGVIYGIVFIGWGLGAFMPKLGGIIQDATGTLDLAFYISGTLLIIAVILALIIKEPAAPSKKNI